MSVDERAADRDLGWCILELMGHRRLGGVVTETTLAGKRVLRIDVPAASGDGMATQFYGGDALYCLTPTTEETARALARSAQPAPVHRWELTAPKDEAPTNDERELEF